jgi:hypothetical protein
MSYCGGQLGIQIYTNMKTLSGTIQCLIRVQFTFNQVSGFWEKIFLQFSHRVQCYNFALQWQSCGIFNRHTKKETFVREDKNISKIFFSKLTLWQISSEMVTINIKKTLLSTRRNPNFIKIWKYDYFRIKSQRHEVVCSNFILRWQPIRFSISTKKKWHQAEHHPSLL